MLFEILQSTPRGLIVSLPTVFHSRDNLSKPILEFWQKQIVWTYPRLKNYLDMNYHYGNANVTRPFIGYNRNHQPIAIFNKWKEIWNGKSVLIVEGETTRFGVGNDLLYRTLSCRRILAPKHDAFSKAKEIADFILKDEKTDLILVALGPAAKYLVYLLHKDGCRAIDIGNLDIEYEWFMKGKQERVVIEGKYTSEAKGGRNVGKFPNEEAFNLYKSQIIAQYL